MAVSEERVDLKFGQFLAHPEPGDEVVISGIAGAFPNSHSVLELGENLYNKIEMVDDDDRRWEDFNDEIPHRSGKIYDVTKFDAGYFGSPHHQVSHSDPMIRIGLEKTVEAILDAGVNPAELEGTNTGVYVGVCFSDSENHMINLQAKNSFPLLGCSRSFIVHKISQHLKLNGPIYSIDTACSSSLFALEHAFKDLRMGNVENAIVGSLHLCLHPYINLQFKRLGVLSPDGSCKSFDESANGYARSETISMCFLQKKKFAKRNYCQILHMKTNSDGFKNQGINFPSRSMQTTLFEEALEESGIDHLKLGFVEAHGTGTYVGDPEECGAIDTVFTKDRKTPLMIGSIKSNLGHTEPSAGMCSLAKVILALENNLIPPNLHFNVPKKDIEGIIKGRLQVVTESTPFQDDNGMVAINSFGFGGANCHTLVQKNCKEKINISDPIPRLVCVSGRTKEAIDKILDSLSLYKFDKEHIGLIHEIFFKPIPNHLYRGYAICSETEELKRSSTFYEIKDHQLCLVFTDIQDYYKKIGKDLMILPEFSTTMKKIDQILTTHNTEDIKENSNANKNLLSCIVIQLGIAAVLQALQLQVDYVIGQGIHQLTALYYLKHLELDEVLAIAYNVAKICTQTLETTEVHLIHTNINKINLEAHIGIKQIGNKTLLTGSKTETSKMLKTLPNNIKVDKLSIQHAKLTSKEISVVMKKLDQLIPEKKKPLIEHFLQQLNNHEEFFTSLSSIKPSVDFLEIGNGNIKKILESTAKVIQCDISKNNNITEEFLSTIGDLYQEGYQPQVQNLYPKIEFPVSRGTPMISPYIGWHHETDWYVPNYNNPTTAKMREKKFRLPDTDEDWSFVFGHVVDGRMLFPAAGYLRLAWLTLASLEGVEPDATAVSFENCRFLRSTIMIPKYFTFFCVRIQEQTGNFEITANEEDEPVMKGRITLKCNFRSFRKNISDEDKLVMNTKDIYKELRLRGYNYKGVFRALTKVNVEGTEGLIKWEDNWVSYIDNMLQMKILGNDTRLLYVPTSIDKISIDPVKHIEICTKLGEKPEVPVFSYLGNVIQSGGCEIRGIWASSIPRKKQTAEAVLERHVFVPNFAQLPTDRAIRVITQIILENAMLLKVQGVELVDDSAEQEYTPLSTIVCSALGDQPMIKPVLSIFTKRTIEDVPQNIEIEDKTLVNEKDLLLIIGSKLLSRPIVVNQAKECLRDEGFILSRESMDCELNYVENFDIINCYTTDTEKLVLLKKKTTLGEAAVVNISSLDNIDTWLSELQTLIQGKQSVIVVAENSPETGILGFINCLRREPGNLKIKCVYIKDTAAPFSLDDPLYAEQVKKNMAVNIYQDKTWGTYRHLILEPKLVLTPHMCFSQKTPGDLSSVHWKEGSLGDMNHPSLVYIYYGCLNFRDVLIASGKLIAQTPDRKYQDEQLGFEYVGRDQNGKRIMGMSPISLSTLTLTMPLLYHDVPGYWTMEEAATVPCVYYTVLYSFLVVTKLKKGESILIHSGTGGVGQAAIRIAHYYGCKIYVTVGGPEKREFLKSTFPYLTDDVIFSSRDGSFEYDVKKATKGHGVDMVLNSLADDFLYASVRCLAKGGRFLEIGKYNLLINSPIGLHLFQNGQSYHGIMADALSMENQVTVGRLLTEHIKNDSIQPLNRTIFEVEELEKAFRYMGTGKHTGKVLIKLRDEEDQKIVRVSAADRLVAPRFYCKSHNTQIVLGGLGGFGLELADWIILRGAKNIVLNSRTGIKTGYQQYRINIWRSYGVNVKISTADVTTRKGCEQLLNEAASLGPVESIFNLAVVLKDALFENQKAEDFKTSLNPKAVATSLLDELTRNLCPELKHFVVFSSVVAGRGNVGQTNYGLSNSIMERICENRHKEGLPAIAIQWGAIGEVGLVADMQEEHMDITIGGTLQQRLSDCMKCLDIMLHQDAPVVASMVVAEKKGSGVSGSDAVSTVAAILGLKDIKSVSPNTTLAELGMDSMTAVEIKQTLETDFDIFLNPKDMRELTFAKLVEIQNNKEKGGDSMKDILGIDMLFKSAGDEIIMSTPVTQLESNNKDLENPPDIIIFPGIDGVVNGFEEVSKELKANVFGLKYLHSYKDDVIQDLANSTLEHVRKIVSKDKPFNIVGYSFGSFLALEVVKILESEGYHGQLTLVDGSPTIFQESAKPFNVETRILETLVIIQFGTMFYPVEKVEEIKPVLYKCSTLEEQIKTISERTYLKLPFSLEYFTTAARALINKLKSVIDYEIQNVELKTKISLIKASKTQGSFSEDYDLSALTGQEVEVVSVEGNHYSMLQNVQLAEEINKRLVTS